MDYVLKLHHNVHGQKQAGRVWNQYLVTHLVNTLEYVSYHGNVVYVLYTDDSILAGPSQDESTKLSQISREQDSTSQLKAMFKTS